MDPWERVYPRTPKLVPKRDELQGHPDDTVREEEDHGELPRGWLPPHAWHTISFRDLRELGWVFVHTERQGVRGGQRKHGYIPIPARDTEALSQPFVQPLAGCPDFIKLYYENVAGGVIWHIVQTRKDGGRIAYDVNDEPVALDQR